MKYKEKLEELLNHGEGHTIFKTDSVIDALKESGFAVEVVVNDKKKPLRLKVTTNERQAAIFLEHAPTSAPKSKYDIVSWNGSINDTGVHDLGLVEALVDLTGGKYTGGSFGGRGFQYRAYREWLRQAAQL